MSGDQLFWLLGFALIGLTGTGLTFARRYKNDDPKAGYGTAGWTIFFLFVWLASPPF